MLKYSKIFKSSTGQTWRARIREGSREGTREAKSQRVPEPRRHPRERDDAPGGEPPAGACLPALRRVLRGQRLDTDPRGEHTTVTAQTLT